MNNNELSEFEQALMAERDAFMNNTIQRPVGQRKAAYKPASPAKPVPPKPPAVGDIAGTSDSAPVKQAAKPKRKSSKPKEIKQKPVHRVVLRVREKQLAVDEEFVYESSSLSKLEAELDARKAAKEAGWGVVTYVIDFLKP